MEWLPYIFLVAAWLVYFALHSILATNNIKGLFSTLNYRLFFNLFAVISLAIPAYFHFTCESALIWDNTISAFLGLLISIIGLIIIKQSFKGYSLLHFLGLQKTESSTQLHLEGWNKRVRHPLYFGSIVFIAGWFLFSPTLKMMISAIMMITYFVIGSSFEEKRLLKQFGNAYADYQMKTPKLFPKIFTIGLLSFFLVSCTSNDERFPMGYLTFENDSLAQQIICFKQVPTLNFNDTIFLDTVNQYQFIGTKSGNGFILSPTCTLHISKNQITGNGASQTLFFQDLQNEVLASEDSLAQLISNPNIYWKWYTTANRNRESQYQKTFVSKDVELQKVYKVIDLCFKIRNANNLLSYWKPYTNLFMVTERIDSLRKGLNNIHHSLVFHPYLFQTVENLVIVKDSSQNLPKIDSTIINLYNLRLPQTGIFHFQLLASWKQKFQISQSEIEHTINYEQLPNLEMYEFFVNLNTQNLQPKSDTLKVQL